MSRNNRLVFAIALGVALALGTFLSPFASSSPDGLEKVAHDKGFIEKSEGAPAWRFALMPDYAVPGVSNNAVATALSGLVGTRLVFGAGLGLVKVAARLRAPEVPDDSRHD